MPIKSLIRTIPDYPKPGIMFRDITTLLKDPVGFRVTINEFVHRYTGAKIDKIAGIESRGFIIGAALAFQLGVGFVPIRKKGKLPAADRRPGLRARVRRRPHRDPRRRDRQGRAGAGGRRPDRHRRHGRSGGQAGRDYGRRSGGVCVVIDLPDLGGRKRLEKLKHKVFTLCEFEGD